jgi:hypothetical protein
LRSNLQTRLSSKVEAAATVVHSDGGRVSRKTRGQMDARSRFEVLKLTSAAYPRTESPALERVQQ